MGMFDFINTEAEAQERNYVAPLVEYQVEAYQIVRLKKQTMGGGKMVREIVDTIAVKNGSPKEAQRRAVLRANAIGGGCFVVEKCERIISMNKKEQETEDTE